MKEEYNEKVYERVYEDELIKPDGEDYEKVMKKLIEDEEGIDQTWWRKRVYEENDPYEEWKSTPFHCKVKLKPNQSKKPFGQGKEIKVKQKNTIQPN